MNHLFSNIGDFTIGSLTLIDLIAATTNAFNGTILASRRDHYRHWTIVGIIMIAIIGGIGGGVTRDVFLNLIPSAFQNPWYLICSFAAAMLGLAATKRLKGNRLRRTFNFMAAFSLPWYAIVGSQKALEQNLPLLAVFLIGVVGPTAGPYFLDITSGVTPQLFTRGEWFVGTAFLTSVVYVVLYLLGLRLGLPSSEIWPATIIAFLVGFGFRLAALHFKWTEPQPWEQMRLHETRPATTGEPDSSGTPASAGESRS